MRSWWRGAVLSSVFTVLVGGGCGKSDAPPSAPAQPKKAETPAAAAPGAEKTPTMDFSEAQKNEDKKAAEPQAPAAAPGAAPSPSPASTDEAKPEDSPAAGAQGAGSTVGDGAQVPELGLPFLLKRDGLMVETLTLSKGFEKSEDGKRVPVEPGYSFPCDDRRVYVILDLVNPGETEGELKVGWIKPGSDKEGNAVPLSVTPKKTWRTFAFNGFANSAPGKWQVVIRDSDDTVLARASFEMKSN